MADLVVALVHGEDRAQAEEHESDDEGVEEPAPSIPELVQAGGLFSRPTLAEQQ